MSAGRVSVGAPDVVIIGGAIMGSSVAFHLLRAGFDGRIMVIERDASYEQCSTAHTNSCLRQQFSHPLNVEISRDTARYIRELRAEMGDDRVPEVQVQYFGYLYLAADALRAEALARDQAMQARLGAATRMMRPDEIAQAWPFLNLDGIRAGSHNPVDEGYFDGGALFAWWRRLAQARGAQYLSGEVVAISREGARVTGVTLADGSHIAAGIVVNAAGPRAGGVAAMAGLALPVAPRKRMTWLTRAARPLDRPLPLVVDPSGVHMHSDGAHYMIGAAPREDGPVAPDDFTEPQGLWQEHVWPIVAARIPQFDQLRVVQSWAGHYAYNEVDRNAIVGPHPEVGNFLFINGFSGHGLQQSPAMGRGLAEWIMQARFASIDLSPFAYERLAGGRGGPVERAVI